jgi:hypothetical protein
MKPFSFKQRRRGSRGFTISELAVAGGISGMIAVVCMVSYMALQKVQSASLARSEMRSNVIRVFDFVEADLRNATAVSGTTSGNYTVLPITITTPQRYTSFEASGPMGGDPGKSAARIAPTVNTTNGKLTVSSSITITYSSAPQGTASLDLIRSVIWTENGAAKRASRTIATLPKDSTLRFRSGTSTSASPAPIKSNDYSISASLSAPFAKATNGTGAPTSLETLIFLRRKSIK